MADEPKRLPPAGPPWWSSPLARFHVPAFPLVRSSRLPTRRYAAWGLVVLLIAASPVAAHPLGNDTITHFSVLFINPNRIELDFHLDFAEIPANAARESEIDADRDGIDTADEQRAWLDRKAVEHLRDLRLELDGSALAIRLLGEAPASGPASAPAGPPTTGVTRTIMSIAGVAGMPTYRLMIRYVADLPADLGTRPHTLTYLDASYPRNPGLKRVLIGRSDAIVIDEKDRQYLDEPPDPFLYELYDPSRMPQEREGRVVFRIVARPVETPRQDSWARFTDPRNDPARTDQYRRQAKRIEGLFAGGLSLPVLALVAALCFGYGAYHALMPGHAKTIVAAYLISMRGTWLHAVALAVIVTLTHTALVIVVGLVFLKVSAPAGSRLQLWLGLSAGLMIAGMGAWLLFRAVSGRLRLHHAHATGHDHHEHDHHDHHHAHSHEHGHSHHHHAGAHDHGRSGPQTRRGWLRTLFTHSHPPPPVGTHGHAHDHDHEHAHGPPGSAGTASATAAVGPQLTWRLLVWLGVSGGIVPCPAAVWIMLLGIAQGKPGAGLFAVLMFGAGLALTLMLIGLLALSSRRFAERLMGTEGSQRWLLGVLPAMGGLVVLALGGVITANYAMIMARGEPLIAGFG